MTPAELVPGRLRRDRCRCAAGSRWLEALTSGATEVRADPDGAVWHQKADLPDLSAPSGLSNRPPELPDSWTSWAAATRRLPYPLRPHSLRVM